MKILIVCQHFYPEQFRVNDISFELVKRGHEVTVLTGLPNYPQGKIYPDYKNWKNKNEKINNVNIIRSFMIGRGKSNFKMAINYLCFAFFGSLKALTLLKNRYDIVYSYQLSPITMVLPAIVVKRKLKIPLVIHCLDQWPISLTMGPIKETDLIYKFFEKISIWIYKEANLILISSRSFEKYLKQKLKIKGINIVYCPSYAEDIYKDVIYTESKSFNLVFAGNIGPAQSVETIIYCANILKEQKKIKFHIIGDGLNKKNCEKITRKFNLGNVKFYSFRPVSEMLKFYNIADAFLITMADNEVVNMTLPAKIQSYAAAGKPIFGAINGEVKETIRKAQCGVCVDSLDYKNLAKIISKLYTNNKKLREWGKNAKMFYNKNWEKENHIKNLENLFSKSIKEKLYVQK